MAVWRASGLDRGGPDRGLLFGHLGFPNAPGAATFGFTLFIFSVGLQAGPRFFSVFLEHGLRYVVLAIVVAVTGIGLALLAARVIDLGYGMSAGLLAGALTSTPTLGVISEAARSPVPSLGYAGTYTFANVFLTFAGTLL